MAGRMRLAASACSNGRSYCTKQHLSCRAISEPGLHESAHMVCTSMHKNVQRTVGPAHTALNWVKQSSLTYKASILHEPWSQPRRRAFSRRSSRYSSWSSFRCSVICVPRPRLGPSSRAMVNDPPACDSQMYCSSSLCCARPPHARQLYYTADHCMRDLAHA